MTGVSRRLPIESGTPIVVFAMVRLLIAVASVVAVAAVRFPYGEGLQFLLAGLAVPWAVFNFALARRSPEGALNPLIAASDIVILVVAEIVAPEVSGATQLIALSFLAVHAHFQGERIGLMIAAFAAASLIAPPLISQEGPVKGDQLIFYELVFVASALVTVGLVGRFRTTESASRLRARELSRRALESERQARRRLAEALHDGPVQEMIGLDMVLTAARHKAQATGDAELVATIQEARETAGRNVQTLRDEMLDLGPYGYDDFSFEAAVERCLPVWQRRYGIEAELDLEPLDLPSEQEGELFRITQECVANAARHGRAGMVVISLSMAGSSVGLSVSDDGGGFGSVDPLGATEPGHIGLASMRERCELMDGSLEIESSEQGSTVTVSVPRPRRGPRDRHRRPR
jgi:signal transduction histidine kinase